ncbi:MAG TPA: hypothetical protein IAC12_08235 [Candidatus Aphodovivens avistercoris]|nr:hypothetical protein [Candidatus Aphodovivens avistercoris]
MIAELEGAVALTAPSDAPFSDKGTFAAILENAGVSVDFDDRLNTLEDLPMKLLTEDLVALLPRHLERYLENTHPGKFQFASWRTWMSNANSGLPGSVITRSTV